MNEAQIQAIQAMRKICGFYRRETYFDGAPSNFCDMRHRDYDNRIKEVTLAGECWSGEMNNCPFLRVINELKNKE